MLPPPVFRSELKTPRAPFGSAKVVASPSPKYASLPISQVATPGRVLGPSRAPVAPLISFSALKSVVGGGVRVQTSGKPPPQKSNNNNNRTRATPSSSGGGPPRARQGGGGKPPDVRHDLENDFLDDYEERNGNVDEDECPDCSFEFPAQPGDECDVVVPVCKECTQRFCPTCDWDETDKDDRKMNFCLRCCSWYCYKHMVSKHPEKFLVCRRHKNRPLMLNDIVLRGANAQGNGCAKQTKCEAVDKPRLATLYLCPGCSKESGGRAEIGFSTEKESFSYLVLQDEVGAMKARLAAIPVPEYWEEHQKQSKREREERLAAAAIDKAEQARKRDREERERFAKAVRRAEERERTKDERRRATVPPVAAPVPMRSVRMNPPSPSSSDTKSEPNENEPQQQQQEENATDEHKDSLSERPTEVVVLVDEHEIKEPPPSPSNQTSAEGRNQTETVAAMTVD
jgi:hypothetical protein